MTPRSASRNAGSRAVVGILAAGVIMLTALGLWRYGGPEGLWRRISVEIAALRPHPQFVPTPLPAPGAAAAVTAPAQSTRVPTASLTEAAAPYPTPTAAAALERHNLADCGTQTAPCPTPTAAAALERHNLADCDTQTTPCPPATLPAATHTPTATSTPYAVRNTPSATLQLTGLSHAWQTWNNCGPATLAMNLSYFGAKIGQDDDRRGAAAFQG